MEIILDSNLLHNENSINYRLLIGCKFGPKGKHILNVKTDAVAKANRFPYSHPTVARLAIPSQR